MLSSLHIRRFLSLMPNPQHRGAIFGAVWSRKLGKEIAIAAVGLTFLFFIASSTFDSWWKGRRSRMPTPLVSDLVDLTLVRNAKEKGAVCLDGSPPAYHFQRGFGSGLNSWHVHIEGGGWCDTLESCASRKMTLLGSSGRMERQILFTGMFSSDKRQNPDLFNWNKVRIRYCDGASFSGNVKNEVQESSFMSDALELLSRQGKGVSALKKALQ